MKKRLWIIISIILTLSLLITACSGNKENNVNRGNNSEIPETMGKDMSTGMADGKMDAMLGGDMESISEGKGYPVTIKDRMGNEVTLDKKPEKIAAISGTFLGVLYSVGGESICTAELGGGSPAPEGVEKLPSIGHVYNPDIEKIVGLKPDLVIAQFGLQNKIVPVLKDSGIPVLSLQMKTYDEVLNILKIMGRITEKKDIADELISNMEKDKKVIMDKLPNKRKKAVILYVTSKDISVKLDNSIAGNVANILKIENIASGSKPDGMGGESTPFSLEAIVEKDPDVILVTSMISDNLAAQNIIEGKLGKDPVWKELRAVKEGKIVYLPQKYFLYNAGTEFVRGIEYMAKGVYPEIYGEINE